MTLEEFKQRHKENYKRGFDTLDGTVYWDNFVVDLEILLASERRKMLEKQQEAINSAIGCLHVIAAEAQVISNNSDNGSRAWTLSRTILDERGKAHKILTKASS